MRILYYNWTPLNVKSTGGGVAVYVHNLIQYICEKSTDDFDVTFLSSGYYFDDTKKEVYIRKEETHPIGSYSIINSPVIAPLGCMSYNSYEMLLKDNKLVEVFDGFIQKYGPFDVVHFQTLEGLSPQVLSLKSKYSNTKFIHSLHDYGCFCPNVKFWTRGGENCVLKQGTEDCYRCNIYAGCRPLKSLMVERNGKKQSRFMRRMGIGLSLINRGLFDLRTPLLDKNSIYQSYRKSCVNHINQYMDVELAVSNRVKEIAVLYGIRKEKLQVSYIGTKVAEKAIGHCANTFDGNILTILYMGYANKAKGFFFLLDALEHMDESLSKRITVKFASKIADRHILHRINAIRERFRSIIIYDGYTHKDFPTIFENVNLGIVPPLWEDNLPQVTIEMIANGIPVITSNNGGAKELNSHSNFVFIDKEDLIQKIATIYKSPSLLDEYWTYSAKLTTMEAHMTQLLKYYSM